MGRIYKRGKNWYVDLRVKGRRIRKKVGPSKKLAQLALQDAEVKVARDEFGFSKSDIALAAFFDRFLEYSRTNHRPASTERYRAVIDHFKAFLSSTSKVMFISEVSAEVLDRYKSHRRNTWANGSGHLANGDNGETNGVRRSPRANTINFELDTLRMIFNLAIKWGYLKENPTKRVARLKVDDAKAPRFLSLEECQRFLKACSPTLYPVYFTFLNTGMRKAELENLQWRDVDLKRRRLQIRSKENWQPKTGQREIPINGPLLEVLKELRAGSSDANETDYVFPLRSSGRSHNMLRNDLIKIAKMAEIPDLTKVHTLRHTFASHLVMQGVDLPTVQKLMGHSDIETTLIYAHLAPDHLANAVTKLPFKRP